jgi:RecA/RadA recombinase
MEYDENLYDFMKSLIPFYIQTSNAKLNDHLLNTNGLEKGQCLNIYYNDVVGKRELCDEIILSAILPKEWSLEEEMSQDGSGQVGQT